MGDPATITLTRDGKTVSVPVADAPSLLASGYGVESAGQTQQREEGQLYQERDPGVATAAAMGVLRGATLGGSDVVAKVLGGGEDLKDVRDRHPIASTIGEMAGALSPIGPSAMLNRIGERVVAAGEGAGLAAKAAYATGGAGIIGAGQGAGDYVSQVALDNAPLSAEGFVGAMGKGALYGGVAGGALSVASNGLIAARKLIPLAEQTPEAALAAETTARRAVGDSIETSKGLEATGANEVTRVDRETQQMIQDLEAERAQAMRQVAPEAGPAGETQVAQTSSAAPAVESPTEAPTPETAPAEQPQAPAPKRPAEGAKTGKDARQLLKDWRSKYPEGAVDYDSANAAARRERLQKWADGFEAKTPEDETIKAYFQSDQDPVSLRDEMGQPIRQGMLDGAPAAVKAAANRVAGDAAHEAYLAEIPRAMDVSDSGTEAMARSIYASRRAAARALDDVYAAYKAGQPIVDIRAAATQKLTGQLHELAEARNDLLQSLAKSPESDSLLEKLKAMKAAVDESGKLPSIGERILQGAPQPTAIDPDEAITKALGKSKDVNEDIADIAPKITRYEAAKATLTESLGPKASQQAQEHAAAFRAAQQKAESASARQVAQATENIDKAANGAPLEKMVGGKPVLGGLMKQASNAGAAYEALREMGIPLPDPKGIPVIGPILSMYLKAKILGKMMGKFGGSFAATAEGTIAAKAAATRNRIISSIDALAAGAEKVAVKAPIAVAPVAALGYKLFDTQDKQPYSSEPKLAPVEKMYQDRMSELTAAMQPGTIEQAVRNRIHTSDPTIVDAIVAAETNRLQYLYAQAPKPVGPPMPGQPQRPPSRVEIENWGITLAAAHDPAAVYERVAAGGTARPAEVDCINNCYPQLAAEARKRLVERLSTATSAPSYMRRVAISTLTGIPMDSTMMPDHMVYLQSGFRAPPPAPAAPNPSPTLASNINIGAQTMTRLDR